MSLTDLWAAHISTGKAAQLPAAAAHSAVTARDSAAAPLKRKRVSEDPIQQRQPPSRGKVTPKILPAGETDLGCGSTLIYQPRTFKQSHQLFKTLQVAM